MTPILRFREWCIELMSEVNTDEMLIHSLVMGVKEEHIIKKLRDRTGVCLCVNYPDATGNGADDAETDVQACYFFVVQKVNPGSQTDDQEIQHYHQLQYVMNLLRKAVHEGTRSSCVGLDVDVNDKIEWEYQIFGGFNGLSMGVKITDIRHGFSID